MPEAEVIEGEATEIEEEQQVRNLPAVRAHEALVAKAEITVEELVAQADKISQVMQAAMTRGVHYGQIPGIQKPTLLKPGAEKLCVLLRLAPSYKSEKEFHGEGHLTVVSNCTLTHIPTGLIVAEGEGLCSTHESKYAWRGEGRTCPVCGEAGTIKKSRYAPRSGDYPGATPQDPPGWYCHSKAGGCGANFAAGDDRITDQTGERVANPNLPDTWNTVLKMADKRALVAAVLNGTAASDVFTQDAEDSAPAGASTAAGDAPGAEEFPRGNAGPSLPASFPAGPDLLNRVGEALSHVDPSVDWKATWDVAIKAHYGYERTSLAQGDFVEAQIRLALVADDLTSTIGDFPLPDADQIARSFAQFFEGVKIKVVYHEPEPEPTDDNAGYHGHEVEPDDSIPFGE